MLSFYKALALGPMGVVSPLGSLGVVVPAGVGLALGERPGIPQVAGIAVAVTGVVLAGGPELRGAPVQRRAVVLTLIAALGFGTEMSLIAEASTTVTGLFLALFVQRVANVTVSGTSLYVSVRRGARALPEGGGAGLVLRSMPYSPSSASPMWRPTAPTRSPRIRGRSPSPPSSPPSTR